MPKIVEAGSITSISNSQKNKAKKLSQAIKLGLIRDRNSRCICDTCGQESASASPDMFHAACPGFFEGKFQDPILDHVGQNRYLRSNGVEIKFPTRGRWIREATFNEERNAASEQWGNFLASQVIVNVTTDENGNKSVVFTDGLNEPLNWDPIRKAWSSNEDEKVSTAA